VAADVNTEPSGPPEPELDPPEPGPEPGASEPGPPPWSGPWANDARRLFQVFATAAEQLGAEPTMAVLRRAGPEVLDRVSELAAGLADALRTMDRAADPADPATGREPDPADDPVTAPAGDSAADSVPHPESGAEAEPEARAGSGGTPGPRSGGVSAAPRPPSTVRIDVTD
jgi:hypothetical protein